jgi:DNA-binding GntR family transcriptional regulator
VAGEFPVGGYLPGIKQLSARYGVAASTAHRAVVLFKDWGMIDGEPGQRAKVLGALVPVESAFEQVKVELETARGAPGGRQLLDLEVRRAGQIVARLTAEADPRSADDLRRLLVGSIRRSGEDPSKIADYEMDIRSGDQLLITFVVF